jgi:hypothetical protein
MKARFPAILAGAALLCSTAAVAPAQWLEYPTKGLPRTPDGKPNLAAPTPRLPGGKPDLSGMWVADNSRQLGNLAADVKDVPFLPWAEKLFNERRAGQGKDDPEARCMPQGVPKVNTLPYPYRFINTPDRVVILYEMYYLYRQIYTDGRELPKEILSPSWMGYSTGKWDGDVFVAETAGFNDKMWMDTNGHPHTEQLHVTERFQRKDFGHMEVGVTITDPGAYSKPWSTVIKQHFVPDTELLEFVCEKNDDPQHMVGPNK